MPGLRLRDDIRWVQASNGGMQLHDMQTGRTYQFPASVNEALKTFAASDTALAQSDEINELSEILDSLGLLNSGLSAPQIEERQKAAVQKERETLRWERIKKTLEHAFEKVPFYRARFQSLGLTPDDFHSIGDLDQLPPTTKADIRQNFPTQMLAVDTPLPDLLSTERYSLAQTSGTTGDRLQVLFDHTQGHLPSITRAMWGLSNDAPLSHGGIFTSPICAGFECHLEERQYDARIRATTLTFNTTDDFFSAPDAVIRNIAEEMQRFEPHALFVNAWYAVWWLHRAQGLNVNIPKLTAILPAYQYPTRVHRRLLSEGFGAQVYSNYGSTDLGGAQAGLECSHGAMHIREDKVWLDVTRGGKRVKDGELGKINVTTLENPYMPLIRYEVGDVGRRVDAECHCAVGETWRTFEVHGRMADVLWDAQGAPLTTRNVDDALGDEGPDFYTLLQEGPARYRLEYLSFRGATFDAFQDRLRSCLGPSAQLNSKAVRRFNPEKSLKYRQTGMTPSLLPLPSW